MRIVAGEWGGRRIQAPPDRDTRPTTDRVREAWLSALTPHLGGARVLDLFAGSGALGIEALSRGASHATFVENGPAALRVLRSNLESLGAVPRSSIVRTDALRYVGGLAAGVVDVAFADPPYGKGYADALVRLWLERPFARILTLERGRSDPVPEVPNAREKRYGDTILTFYTAEE
ncbi:MAG: 16S rRNA (guanine(966)-N(2))-methyltransferase RsmD [Gemmatimonadetes bacterium]|nr:16S rRNA (guanine(966)-N(2))-methyltransferase RsmD [Gemmatimonadota bacterium]